MNKITYRKIIHGLKVPTIACACITQRRCIVCAHRIRRNYVIVNQLFFVVFYLVFVNSEQKLLCIILIITLA